MELLTAVAEARAVVETTEQYEMQPPSAYTLLAGISNDANMYAGDYDLTQMIWDDVSFEAYSNYIAQACNPLPFDEWLSEQK